MPRSRNIKYSFFTNDQLAECDSLARLMFIGLWTLADKRGRIVDRPKKIKAEILPFDNCDVSELLDQLATNGFLERYESDGVKCISITNFEKHQRPHPKEPESEIPPPKKSRGKTRPSRGKTRQGMSEPGKVPAEQQPCRGKTRQDALLLLNSITSDCCSLNVDCCSLNPECADPGFSAFEHFWKCFPSKRKTNKRKAAEAFERATKRADVQTILSAAAEFAASEKGRGEFCPMPTTWLNGDCWEDDRCAWNPTASEAASRVSTDDDDANWNPVDGGLGVRS